MECIGLGPDWLTEILRDFSWTDLCVNGSQGAFIDQGEGLVTLSTPYFQKMSLAERDHYLRNWVIQQLSLVGKTWDAKYPFIDATLPTGHRIHVGFPPLSQQGILISLRRLPWATRNQETSMGPGHHRWASKHYQTLIEATRQGDSILISGATGSGKTTLAGDLLAEVPSRERIIALEDTPELSPSHPHFLSLVSRPANSDGYGEVSLRMLLKQTLRMRPDRIILGECRGAEVLDLLQALNTGHRGALATLHANSPREALKRIELLCLMNAGGNIPLSAIRELLSLGIQWVVQVKKVNGTRKITDLFRIEGREGDTILFRPMVE